MRIARRCHLSPSSTCTTSEGRFECCRKLGHSCGRQKFYSSFGSVQSYQPRDIPIGMNTGHGTNFINLFWLQNSHLIHDNRGCVKKLGDVVRKIVRCRIHAGEQTCRSIFQRTAGYKDGGRFISSHIRPAAHQEDQHQRRRSLQTEANRHKPRYLKLKNRHPAFQRGDADAYQCQHKVLIEFGAFAREISKEMNGRGERI